MLRQLLIKNLLLIEEAIIPFERGFTAITGETGAGKTALIEAIRLVLGEQKDPSRIRRGADRALVQASFDLLPQPALSTLLMEGGVDFFFDEPLILSREIALSGKSRSLINGQVVPSSLLQRIAPYLVDSIGQYAQIELRDLSKQRELLDLFAQIDLSPFQSAWNLEKQLEKKLLDLQGELRSKEGKREWLQTQLEELSHANIGHGEEDLLFDEYTLLSNTEEILSKSSEAIEHVDLALTSCSKLQLCLRHLLKVKSLLQGEEEIKGAFAYLGDIRQAMVRLQAQMENDPNRLAFLESRLHLIGRLKKKYGPHLPDMAEEIKRELIAIDELIPSIEATTSALEKARIETSTLAKEIGRKRIEKGGELAELLSSALQQLNIPSAKVTIRVSPAHRSISGEDSVSFFLKANQGEHPSEVGKNTSGGELCRLFFALKLILSEKIHPSTFLFDEIDANVGGATATLIGLALQKLGTRHQILYITHFPQVAQQGDHHIRIYKEDLFDRTHCRVETLNSIGKEEELMRMQGGNSALLP